MANGSPAGPQQVTIPLFQGGLTPVPNSWYSLCFLGLSTKPCPQPHTIILSLATYETQRAPGHRRMWQPTPRGLCFLLTEFHRKTLGWPPELKSCSLSHSWGDLGLGLVQLLPPRPLLL